MTCVQEAHPGTPVDPLPAAGAHQVGTCLSPSPKPLRDVYGEEILMKDALETLSGPVTISKFNNFLLKIGIMRFLSKALMCLG